MSNRESYLQAQRDFRNYQRLQQYQQMTGPSQRVRQAQRQQMRRPKPITNAAASAQLPKAGLQRVAPRFCGPRV